MDPIGALTNIANGQSGYSNATGESYGISEGNSYGNSYGYSNGEQYSDAFGSAEGQSYNYGYGESMSEGSSWGDAQNWGTNKSWNQVYGTEASAEDIMRAKEANAQQEYFARMQMAYNAEQAQIARDYETMMSNTAYQRAVADLKKAGLNPILAAGNMGATTPVGAVASSGMANANKATTYANQRGGSYGASYGYNKSGSQNHSYGYNKSEGGSSYSSRNESHSYGYNKSENNSNSWSHDISRSGSKNQSESRWDNNLKKVIEGIGDLFSGLSSAQKYGKSAYDGYDNPTLMN